MTRPLELEVRDTKVVVISTGSFIIPVVLPGRLVEASGGWLRTKFGRKELKALAEKQARREAVRRAKKRKQL